MTAFFVKSFFLRVSFYDNFHDFEVQYEKSNKLAQHTCAQKLNCSCRFRAVGKFAVRHIFFYTFWHDILFNFLLIF